MSRVRVFSIFCVVPAVRGGSPSRDFWIVIHKVSRTGAWTTWGLTKHESTEFEQNLQFVGLALVFGSIVLLWSLAQPAQGG